LSVVADAYETLGTDVSRELPSAYPFEFGICLGNADQNPGDFVLGNGIGGLITGDG
jgi:hypothetical protein